MAYEVSSGNPTTTPPGHDGEPEPLPAVRQALPGHGQAEGSQRCRHDRAPGSGEQRRQAVVRGDPGERHGEREGCDADQPPGQP